MKIVDHEETLLASHKLVQEQPTHCRVDLFDHPHSLHPTIQNTPLAILHSLPAMSLVIAHSIQEQHVPHACGSKLCAGWRGKAWTGKPQHHDFPLKVLEAHRGTEQGLHQAERQYSLHHQCRELGDELRFGHDDLMCVHTLGTCVEHCELSAQSTMLVVQFPKPLSCR